MKKILAALLCAFCGLANAQTAQELIDDGKNTENVLTFGMGYDVRMWSPRARWATSCPPGDRCGRLR
jgi:hypothetical protein